MNGTQGFGATRMGATAPAAARSGGPPRRLIGQLQLSPSGMPQGTATDPKLGPLTFDGQGRVFIHNQNLWGVVTQPPNLPPRKTFEDSTPSCYESCAVFCREDPSCKCSICETVCGTLCTSNPGIVAGKTVKTGAGAAYANPNAGLMAALGAPVRGFGVGEAPSGGGTTDPNLQITAQTLASVNPCVSSASSGIAGFQQAWNQTTDSNYGSPQLTVDGKYGPATASALAQVIGGNVNPPCVYCADGSVQPPGGSCASPAPPAPQPITCPPGQVVDTATGNCVPAPNPTPSGGSNTGLIVAAVVAAIGLGGAVAYARTKKKHRR